MVSVVHQEESEEVIEKRHLLSNLYLTVDKRYREKSGRKYKEFIKVLKKKSSKKDDSQDIDCDNPSSTINTHMEENLFLNLKKSSGIDSNLSIKSNDSFIDLKKGIESLICMKLNSTTSSNKSILSNLEYMKKSLESKEDCKIDEVLLGISYRQLVDEVLPFIKNLVKHSKADVSKKASEVLKIIKEKVIEKLFKKHDTVSNLTFNFNFENYDINDLIKSIDNNINTRPRNNDCMFADKLPSDAINRTSNDTSSLNDYSSDAPQDFLIECLFKKDKKKQRLNIFPMTQEQLFHLSVEPLKLNILSEREFFECLKSGSVLPEKLIPVPETKKILRKNICIQLLNIMEKVMADFELTLVKKFVIFIEYKMREKDQNMSEAYQENVRDFFSRIKNFYQEHNSSAYKGMNNY